MPAATPDPMTTLGRALALIHTGVETRAELTARLGVTRTGVSKLIGELADDGLIEVESQPVPGGQIGRPSHGVRPAAGAPLVLAAVVDTTITVALVGLRGEIAQRARRAMPSAAGPDRAVGMVTHLTKTLLRKEKRPVIGAGVAVASAVGATDGTALAAIYLGWPPAVPLRHLIGKALQRGGIDLPVGVANDAHCAALAEYRHGAGADGQNVLYLTSGDHGVGGALIAGGQLYGGRDGAAMEVGHLIVNPGGRPCACGRRGCFDVEVGSEAVRAATSPPGRARIRRHLGVGVAGLINVLNPDRVVLAGSLADLLGDRLSATVADYTLLRATGTVPLVPGRLADAALLGAAEYAFQPLLDDPRTTLAGRGL